MDKCKKQRILSKYTDSLLDFCQERFGFKEKPHIYYITDVDNSEFLLGKTAFYDAEKNMVGVYIAERHPKDILRSLAHELVHHTQNERGDLYSQETLGPGYAQKDSHMREMELQAYKQGNIAFRDWEDKTKSKLKGDLIMISEKKVLSALKKLIETRVAKKVQEASTIAGGDVEGVASEEALEETEELEENTRNCAEAEKDEYGKCPEPEKDKDEGKPEGVKESKIITPEQEESFHNKLFGTRLVALNAKLMSSWIKK